MDQPILLMGGAALMALFAVFSVITTARCFFGRLAPMGYLLILGFIGSLFSLRAWILPYPIEGLVAVAYGAVFLFALIKERQWKESLQEFITPLSLVALAALLLELMWAAAPFYRYDQWNYHLVVAKYMDSLGRLPLPMLDDHIYFTGFYEYLFMLPRLAVKDDIFIHSFASSFTWLTVCYLLYAALMEIIPMRRKTTAGLLAMSCFLIAALPHQHSLTSAKPEVILVACALWAVVLGHRLEEKRSAFWFGWIILFPAIIKVTWLHMGFAIGAAFLLKLLIGRRFEQLGPIVKGSFAAAALAVPVFAKSMFYFGNPLHPVQLGPIHSSFWSEEMTAYWQNTTYPARSLARYFEILLFSIPPSLLELLYKLLVPVVIVIVYHVYQRRPLHSMIGQTAKRYRLIGLALLIYLVTMPFVLDARHMSRFALPVVGLVLPLIISTWDAAHFSLRTSVIGLIALGVIAGNPELRLQKLLSLFKSGTISSYYEAYGNPYSYKPVAEIINKHRRETFPKAKLDQKIVAATNPTKYFFDSTMLVVGTYADHFTRSHIFESRDGGQRSFCLPEYLNFLDVRYVYLSPYDKVEPRSQAINLTVARYGQKLSSQHAVTYLSDEALQLAIRDAEICPEG
jgi:hypothetical protein